MVWDKHTHKYLKSACLWAVDGVNFSERIWSNKQKLIDVAYRELTQGIMLGRDPQKTIDAIAKQMNASKSQVGRLVMTEEAYFASASRKDCFNDLGVEKYVIVATLDNRTSEICQEMDGKVFKTSDYQPGTTAPPFHVNCRSTTAPYFEDMQGIVERAARDENGKVYDVPGSMKYKEWKERFVDSSKDEILKTIQKEYNISVNEKLQSKHIRGSENFDPLRSELTADPQMLYGRYSGKGQFLRTNAGDWNHKERFIHTEIIGIYKSKYTGEEVPTNTGIIHYSKRKGWHIVPARPQKGAEK